MGKRLFALGIALTAVLAIVSCLPIGAYAEQAYYSVGISSSRLYLFGIGASWNSQSSVMLKDFGDTASLSDVAVQGDYVFVTDRTAGTLNVLKISGMDATPTASLVSTIPLSSGSLHVEQPFSVAVSGDGTHVYVAGQVWVDTTGAQHYNYASVTSGTGWTTSTVAVGGLQDAPMVGLASLAGSGAAVAHWDTSTDFTGQPTQISTVHDTSVSGPADANVMDVDEHAYTPRAIATLEIGSNTYAYVYNQYYDYSVDHGGISMFNTNGPSRVDNTFELGSHMMPFDQGETIAAFAYNEVNYLAIAGKADPLGSQQIWLVPLDASGKPVFKEAQEFLFNEADQAQAHYLAASWDGGVLWVANSHAGSVFALRPGSWGSIGSGYYFGSIGEAVRNIADYHYIPAEVPEPAGLLAISIFGASTLGAVRLRRRRS